MKKTVRRILSLVLCAALLCLLLAGCGQPSGPLRVLLDVDNAPGVAGKNSGAECAEQLAARIRSVCGREDVQVETLPAQGSQRQMAITRLRTEIMAGGGPGVLLAAAGEPLLAVSGPEGVDP